MSIEKSSRIWARDLENAPDLYLCFRKKFHLGRMTAPAKAQIAAETDFALYVNGSRVPVTQFPDFEWEKTFSELDLSPHLHEGENTIAVLVWRLGMGNATHRLCPGGLLFALSAGGSVIRSDGSWKVRKSAGYRSGNCRFSSIPVGYRFEFDAKVREDWTAADYDDSGWEYAAELPRPAADGSWNRMKRRPLPPLQEIPPGEVSVIWQGEVLLPVGNAPAGSSGEPFLRYILPENAFSGWEKGWNGVSDENSGSPYPLPLSPGGKSIRLNPPQQGIDGISVILDLGRETTGFPEIEVECEGEQDAVTLEIHHGEHLDDGRVRSKILCADFSDTIHCGHGRFRFCHTLRRIGARYLQLFFTGKITQCIRLIYAGVRETLPILPEVSSFAAPDTLYEEFRESAIRTLRNCMHDHYEDCPWREQSLYAYDSRNQMLYGYYLWGNYDFAEASLDLLGENYFADTGYLALCAPSQDKITIPVYTFTWISAVYEFVLHSGRIGNIGKQLPRINAILDGALKRKAPGYDELYSPGKAEDFWAPDAPDGTIWNFYEWTGDLSGSSIFPQALYQIYLSEALICGSRLNHYTGNEKQAERYRTAAHALQKAIDRIFWLEEYGCYGQFTPEAAPRQKPYEHVQTAMLQADMIPETRKQQVLQNILRNKTRTCTYSSMMYFIRGLMNTDEQGRRFIVSRIRDVFLPMLKSGFDNLWELPEPRALYGYSLCHGWSAVPAYFTNSIVLGVTPLSPGFKTFRVSPFAGNLASASGSVPTPYGSIHVKWKITENGKMHVDVDAPRETEPRIELFPEYNRG